MNPSNRAMRGRLAAAALLLAASRASAFNFETESGLSIDLDTTLTYGVQWRVEDADDNLLRRPSTLRLMTDLDRDFARQLSFLSDPDTVIAQNMDDGNNNFDTGLVSNRATALVDIEIEKDNYGAFVRAKAFYDHVYASRRTAMDEAGYLTMNNAPATRSGDFPDETEDEHGAHAEFLDAYAYASFDVGERVLDLRLGSQMINWGEATFFPGINGMQNRFDASVANVPGTEVKEIFPAGKKDKAAGLLVTDGFIRKGINARLTRNDVIVSRTVIASLTTNPATRASTAWRCATAWSRVRNSPCTT